MNLHFNSGLSWWCWWMFNLMKLYPNYKTNHLQTHIPSINHQMHFKSNYCYYEQMHTRVFDYFQNLIVLRNLSCKGMMLSFLFLSLTCNQLISYLMTSTSMVPWFKRERKQSNLFSILAWLQLFEKNLHSQHPNVH